MYTADDFLGDFRHRYFGDGHRSARYAISTNGEIGKVYHEGLWSEKQGKQLEKHVSTIDCLILSLMHIEMYLSAENSEYCVQNLFLTSFAIKAGAEAIEDLMHIKIHTEEIVWDSKGVKATIFVEDMRVQVELDYVEHKSLSEAEGSTKKAFISHHLIDKKQEISKITFEKEEMNCVVHSFNENRVEQFTGIQSGHQFEISLVEWLVIFSQIGQIIAYHHDQLNRDESENFWMREVKATNKIPIFDNEEPILIQAHIKKSKLLPLHGVNWRTLHMIGQDAKNQIIFEAKVAHQLPSHKGVKAQ